MAREAMQQAVQALGLARVALTQGGVALRGKAACLFVFRALMNSRLI
jgi:hypothetical protein